VQYGRLVDIGRAVVERVPRQGGERAGARTLREGRAAARLFGRRWALGGGAPLLPASLQDKVPARARPGAGRRRAMRAA
jgi:hypothetical protein